MNEQRSAAIYMEELEPVLDSLHEHARRASLRPDAAGDLVQEAVLIGWREFERYEHGTNFRAWIFRILVTTVWNANKRAARQRQHEASGTGIDLGQAFGTEECWGKLLEDPRRLSDLLDERLLIALEALDPEVRQCLLLRWLGDFTYREIATMLRLPAGTIMSHVHRARAELRERLATLALERGMEPERCK